MSRVFIKLGFVVLIAMLALVLVLTLSAATSLRRDVSVVLSRRAGRNMAQGESPGRIWLSILIHAIYLVVGLAFIGFLGFYLLWKSGSWP